ESGNLVVVQRCRPGGDPDPRTAVAADDQQQPELWIASLIPGLSRWCQRLDLPVERFGPGSRRLAAGLGAVVQRTEDRRRAVPVLSRLAELATIAATGAGGECARKRGDPALSCPVWARLRARREQPEGHPVLRRVPAAVSQGRPAAPRPVAADDRHLDRAGPAVQAGLRSRRPWRGRLPAQRQGAELVQSDQCRVVQWRGRGIVVEPL
ncbi:Homoserine/homoserine lactone efflux protein, partial [Pseudomonas sp. FEN]